MPYKKIPLAVSLHLRYLHQDGGCKLPELLKRYPEYSRTTIYRHSRLPIQVLNEDKRHLNKGRPCKLTDRDNRKIVSTLLKLREDVGAFSSTDIQRVSGMKEKNVSNSTLRRSLRRHGYAYTQCRRKGILLKEDLKKRLKFARNCKRLPESFWTEGISFYLDGTGWVHKTNPCEHAKTLRTRTWKKKSESLAWHCTAKGKKEGTAGRMAKFMIAIAYSKGIVECKQYSGNINGQKCADFIRNNFPEMFMKAQNPKGKLFLQDGDPSQNSAKAHEALDEIGCRLFKIPARSPDLNPIENIFHLIGRQLRKDALEQGLENETYESFCKRIRRTVLNFSSEVIDKTVASMPKRIDMIIKSKGLRIKY